jgi:hypothetical protein
MSVLQLRSRPWTAFDPTNRQHRQWYYQYVKNSSWGLCPVRFIVPDDHGDLITMIQRSLIKHYVEQEFSKTAQAKSKSKKSYVI